MKLTVYVRIWLFLTAVLAFESYCLNRAPELSLLGHLKAEGRLPVGFDLDPKAGHTISLWLGWAGIGIMLLTNLYSIRKRLPNIRKLGRLGGWLDFHIFCGLLGPVLVLFHTNFKVGGLVALSFWCMVISFCSGIVGRYFYIQILQQKSGLENQIQATEKRLERLRELSPGVTVATLASCKNQSLLIAGLSDPARAQLIPEPFGTVFRSLAGDLRMRFGLGGEAGALPDQMQRELKRYALSSRKLRYMEGFRQLMGYWHSFHAPFAVFMYIVAAIHIVSSLIFMVNK